MTKDELIEAARLVAREPSDENVATLLDVAFNTSFDDLPKWFRDRPFFSMDVKNSVSAEFFEMGELLVEARRNRPPDRPRA